MFGYSVNVHPTLVYHTNPISLLVSFQMKVLPDLLVAEPMWFLYKSCNHVARQTLCPWKSCDCCLVAVVPMESHDPA